MQDTEMRCGQEVKRFANQLVGCGVFSCEQNLDGLCYCKEIHVGQIKGIIVPVCLSYSGILLEED